MMRLIMIKEGTGMKEKDETPRTEEEMKTHTNTHKKEKEEKRNRDAEGRCGHAPMAPAKRPGDNFLYPRPFLLLRLPLPPSAFLFPHHSLPLSSHLSFSCSLRRVRALQMWCMMSTGMLRLPISVVHGPEGKGPEEQRSRALSSPPLQRKQRGGEGERAAKG